MYLCKSASMLVSSWVRRQAPKSASRQARQYVWFSVWICVWLCVRLWCEAGVLFRSDLSLTGFAISLWCHGFIFDADYCSRGAHCCGLRTWYHAARLLVVRRDGGAFEKGIALLLLDIACLHLCMCVLVSMWCVCVCVWNFRILI
jgi:hypothetical protein